jgi:glyoxylase-like metal-dependent hydrolase (beta-lactamase superfamily II)
MPENIYRFNLGDFRCTIFSDASDVRPLDALTASVPVEELASALVAVGLPGNEIQMGFNVLLLERGGERTLVDTGFGPHIPDRPGKVLELLRQEGVHPESIQRVILTHLDPDHAGGIFRLDGNLTYPNARIWLSRAAWDFYTSEESLATLNPLQARFARRLMPIIADEAEFVEGDQEIAPGIRAIPAPGHRAGHMAIEITSRGETLLHFGDAFNNPVFVIHPDWLGKIDSLPEEARATRQSLFARAADSNALAYAAHLPFPGLGRIRRGEKGYEWEEVSEA